MHTPLTFKDIVAAVTLAAVSGCSMPAPNSGISGNENAASGSNGPDLRVGEVVTLSGTLIAHAYKEIPAGDFKAAHCMHRYKFESNDTAGNTVVVFFKRPAGDHILLNHRQNCTLTGELKVPPECYMPYLYNPEIELNPNVASPDLFDNATLPTLPVKTE